MKLHEYVIYNTKQHAFMSREYLFHSYRTVFDPSMHLDLITSTVANAAMHKITVHYLGLKETLNNAQKSKSVLRFTTQFLKDCYFVRVKRRLPPITLDFRDCESVNVVLARPFKEIDIHYG